MGQWLHRIVMGPEDGGTGGAGAGGGDGGGDGGGTGGDGAGATKPEPITMSAADLAARLERAGRSAVSNLLKEAGIESPAKLRERLAAAQAAEDAGKTELERAQTRATEAERQRDEANREAGQQRIANAVLAEAGRLGVPADRLGAASRLVDTALITVGAQGVEGVAEAVQAMLEANPFLTQQGTGPAVKRGGSDGGAQGQQKPTALDDQEQEAARALGLSGDRYAAAKQGGKDTTGYVVGTAKHLADQAAALQRSYSGQQ